MHPIIFKFGPFTIYSYGLMVAIGFILAAWLGKKNAVLRRNTIGKSTLTDIEESKRPLPTSNQLLDFFIYVLVSGIIGARLFYVLLNINKYTRNPLEILMINHGGLVLYGGVIFGVIVGVWFLNKRKLAVFRTLDIIIPYVALGQSIGRIGCLLNGCCYGRPTNLPIGIYFYGSQERIHPTQIYSSLVMLVIFLIIRFLQGRRLINGQIFLLYFILYSFSRFFIEFLRGDNPSIFIGLTFSQLFSICVFFTSLIFFILLRRIPRGLLWG